MIKTITYILPIHLPCNQIKTAQCYHCITQHAAFYNFSIGLVINKAWAAEMQPVRASAAITY